MSNLHRIRLILIAFSALASVPLSADECRGLELKLDVNDNRIERLEEIDKEISAKSEAYVKEDYNAQRDGTEGQAYRDAARKLMALKKRVGALKESLTTSRNDLSADFCGKCGGETADAPRPPRFCELCPGEKSCGSAPKG